VLSYSTEQYSDCYIIAVISLTSVYSIFLFCTSTNALFALDSCVTSVFLNNSKTYTSRMWLSHLCGGHVVINDVG
jgi:hypothetical protein